MEGVPDLRQVRILHGVMTANSGSFTTITYEEYYKLLQDSSFHHDKALSEGSRRSQIKAHEVFTETSQETCVTEFRQPLQVQSHLEMPRILVQLGHTQRT